MIDIFKQKIISTAIACAITLTGAVGFMTSTDSDTNTSIINASAAANIAKPSVSIDYCHGDKIQIKINNISKYSSSTKFNVYVNNVISKANVTKKDILKTSNGRIDVYRNGKYYLSPNKTYNLKVVAVNGKSKSSAASLKAKTAAVTYYDIKKGAQLYKLKNGKAVKASKLSAGIVETGIRVTGKGVNVAGKIPSKYPPKYVKITAGKYKGMLIKTSDNKAFRITKATYKARIVSDYGASMNGGRYVWGGSSYRATDCSGLVMLSYAQVGISLPHNAASMAHYGKSVSRSSMKPGDIIVMNGGSHVGMYVGNNKFVHAMNSYDGIKVQSVSNLQYYSINTIRRIIY
ncbi:MAG: C40 family peptidase [Oscillospiraceae bacterium]